MSTIREVATMAGVSPATVSRLLNGDTSYKMTEATKQRVWQAVAKLNYQLPASRRQINKDSQPSQTKGKIGCIISTTRRQFVDPYFVTILSNLEQRLKENGYYLSLVMTSTKLQSMMQQGEELGEELEGLILMDSLGEEAVQFLRTRVSCLVGIDTVHKEFDNVGYDHMGVSEMAVHYLYEQGYREIGFAGGSNKMRKNFRRNRRLLGYLTAMEELSLPIREDWILDTGWSDTVCMDQIKRLCQENKLPKAIYAASDLMAVAVLEALSSEGIKVPEEVAVMGVSDIQIARYSNPPLTTIRLFMKELGVTAADLLLQRMNGDRTLPKRVLLPYELVERKSVLVIAKE